MKKLILLLTLVLPCVTFAAGGGLALQDANTDVHDKASLQRGAKLFTNYCMGCHSLKYARFKRMGDDLGISEEQLKENLMFTTDKVGDLMTIAIDAKDAETWFGVAPPDLSVTARSRGADWLYTYLLSFYLDDSKPLGVNNLLFKDVGMPHVLGELQGWQEPVYKTETDHEGKTHQVIASLKVTKAGSMSEAEYKEAVRDIVNFMDYTAEPAKLQRLGIGKWVLAFLVLMFVLSYALKKEYWRDVH